MKKIYLAIVICLLTLGCKEDAALPVEALNLTNEECTNCPEIHIAIPQADEDRKVGRVVNRALTEEIISLLSFDEGSEATDISEAINSFSKGYSELKDRYPDETPVWEARVKGKVVFESEQLLTIRMISYLFTGGAHGYEETRFLNFDKERGRELEPRDLFRDFRGFTSVAEKYFRAAEEIPVEAPINSTGLMFEGDVFYLPDNIGFTNDGLMLLYNAYEVSSFADGPIELIIPFNEVASFLKERYQF